MKYLYLITLFSSAMMIQTISHAEDRIELEVTTIKGNKELPKILYVVPWKDMEKSRQSEQKLVLHSLFGDLFEPVMPEEAVTNSY
jgi:hypothetical protein